MIKNKIYNAIVSDSYCQKVFVTNPCSVCVCVCVRACACVRVFVCVCLCVCVSFVLCLIFLFCVFFNYYYLNFLDRRESSIFSPDNFDSNV